MYSIGFEPFLECSSKGDKRFSAFYAKLKCGKTIEKIYQSGKVFLIDGKEVTDLSPMDAKAVQKLGHVAVNQAEMRALYAKLWDDYFDENPDLIEIILKYRGFTDIFGQHGSACQAEEVYRIWVETMARKLAKVQEQYSDMIVNVKTTKLAKTEYMYCGRGTPWGNEYSHLPNSQALHKVASREEAVAQYYFDLRNRLRDGQGLRAAIQELEGQVLGCYCAPKLCHCATLAYFANNPINLGRLFAQSEDVVL